MLSQTVEYALRAMVHLAAQKPDELLSSEAIAARTKVPKGYLSKILRDLVVAELISSQRGPNGGFALARPPSRISILDVFIAVDPIRRITKCPLGNPAHLKLCPLHRRLDDALALIEREYAKTTLAEVLETNTKSAPQCRALTPATVRVTG
ncbi:MAG: Rrf2 family transcriptional regulator [Phycisphaeraceae bacterium]|nr:Rrf2 family transcriptional regulator [Phycisphaeraceae bacterium]